MRKPTKAAPMIALAAALFASAPAWAEGSVQIKLLATAVLPEGAVTSVKNDAAGLFAAGAVANTRASNNMVPTVAIEYFFTPRLSVETICCVTGHHVTISGGADKGVGALDNVQIIPATFTAKYHLPLGHHVTPYVGAGPALFIMLNDRPSAALQGLGVTRDKLSSDFGVVAQAGLDVAIGHGYGLTLDAKKYWVGTTATFYAPALPGGIALETRHRLDPWVLGAGVSYRF